MKRSREAERGGSSLEERTLARHKSAIRVPCTFGSCAYKNTFFNTYDEFEAHMLNYHHYICQECDRKLPSGFLLDLHIEENHDPFFDLKKDKDAQAYRCINKQCKGLFKSKEERKEHMVLEHAYPINYNFDLIDFGITD